MTPEELRSRLADDVLLLDGAMGTSLMAAGLPPGCAPESWTLDRPHAVEEVHRAYLEAGSDVILTNTFGASSAKLTAAGLPGRCREANRAAVEIARRAAGTQALVAGDIGPCGLLLPPVGQATEEEILSVFFEQASILAEAGVDLLVVETMYDLREALTAVQAARQSGLAVVASMTFVTRPRGVFTIMGNPLTESLLALAAAGADVVGCNCSVTSAEMLPMIRAARATVDLPLVAQPNAGQPHVTAQGPSYTASEHEFARDLAAMSVAGARLVGGCCGTTPAFIRLARAALDSRTA